MDGLAIFTIREIAAEDLSAARNPLSHLGYNHEAVEVRRRTLPNAGAGGSQAGNPTDRDDG